jgi:hypothetical protein
MSPGKAFLVQSFNLAVLWAKFRSFLLVMEEYFIANVRMQYLILTKQDIFHPIFSVEKMNKHRT